MCFFVFKVLYQYPLEYESTECFNDDMDIFVFYKLYTIANGIPTEKKIGLGWDGAIPGHEAISIVHKYDIQETFRFSIKSFCKALEKLKITNTERFTAGLIWTQYVMKKI